MLPPLIHPSVDALREDREGWKQTMLRAVATNVHSGRCVVAEVVLPRVESVRPRSGLTNVTMELEAKHSAGYVVAELFDLFSDISKEGGPGGAGL